MLLLIRSTVAASLPLVLPFVLLLACEDKRPPLEVQTRSFLSKSYVVDQIYRSMKGPTGFDEIQIEGNGPAERIWIISYKTEIVDPMTGKLISEEFMCHNNLDFVDLLDHQRSLGTRPAGRPSPRLFTLSQGAMDVEFPSGFGVPMMSNESLILATQILNLNPTNQTRVVQYKTTVRYVRDADARGRIRPLYQRGIQSLRLIHGEDGYFGVEPGHGDENIHGKSCAVGILAGQRTIHDNFGRSFAAHWVVEPGIQESYTLVSEMLDLKQDVMIHYISVHLHPFADSLELRDLTTGNTVYKSKASNRVGRVGLDHVEYYSSEEGIRLYKDHEYTLISIYNNTSSEQQDAMAVMFLYMVDVNFETKLLAAN